MDLLKTFFQSVFSKLVLAAVFSFCFFESNAQCSVSIDDRYFVCVDEANEYDTTYVGTNMTLTGQPPFIFSWHIYTERTIGPVTLVLTGSDVLNDTTIQYPYIIDPAGSPYEAILTVTDASGCIARDTTIIRQSKASVTLMGAGMYGILQGDSVYINVFSPIFGGIAPVEISWYPPQYVSNPIGVSPGWAFPDTTTEFYMILTDSIGCGYDWFSFKVSVGYQSVDENELDFIRPSPNPTFGRFRILNSELGVLRYELYDLFGAKLRDGTIDNDEVDISELPSGTYLIRVFGRDNTFLGIQSVVKT